MKGWTQSDIDKLVGKGLKVTIKEKKQTIVLQKPEPKGLTEFKHVLESKGISYSEEYKFHAKRKFRFDLAVPELKLAIEYEGLHSTKSRHTTISGFNRDTVKYNLAALDGWIVLRYTASTYGDFEGHLNTIINQNKQ